VLAFDRLGRPRKHGVGDADRLARSHGQRFALGGVAFELLAAGPAQAGFALEPDAARYAVAADRYPIVADVLCSVAIDDAFFADESPYGGLEVGDGAFAQLEHGELVLRAPRVRATLCRIARQRYACSARIAGDPRALTALLRSLVAVVVHAAGGVVVHAAGVAIDDRAVVYVGPSGAGKSTAATLTDGARMFAYDHVALLPQSSGGVLAYGLPGGTAAAMAYTEQVVWPLGAVLRILRDGPAVPKPHAPRARALQGADALFTLREAVEPVDASTFAERARLDAVSVIAAEATIGVLHTVLGVSIGTLVRKHLHQPTRGPRA
jgi:hypothetical protein